MENAKTVTPQEGSWKDIEAYPQKVRFEQDKTQIVTFGENFTEPKEMPNKNSDGVFYIFDCLLEGVKSSISTSSWTLLRSLKSHAPIAGKTLAITKKNVNGKNMFYVETPESFEARIGQEEPKEVDTEDAGLDENKQM